MACELYISYIFFFKERSGMNEYFPPDYFPNCITGCLTHIPLPALPAFYLGLTESKPAVALRSTMPNWPEFYVLFHL